MSGGEAVYTVRFQPLLDERFHCWTNFKWIWRQGKDHDSSRVLACENLPMHVPVLESLPLMTMDCDTKGNFGKQMDAIEAAAGINLEEICENTKHLFPRTWQEAYVARCVYYNDRQNVLTEPVVEDWWKTRPAFILANRLQRHNLSVLHGDTPSKDGDSRQIIYMYTRLSAVRHSCDPNCLWSIEPNSGKLRVVTRRPMLKDEEVTINYYQEPEIPDLLWIGSWFRRYYLQHRYLFVCKCKACAEWIDTVGSWSEESDKMLSEEIGITPGMAIKLKRLRDGMRIINTRTYDLTLLGILPEPGEEHTLPHDPFEFKSIPFERL